MRQILRQLEVSTKQENRLEEMIRDLFEYDAIIELNTHALTGMQYLWFQELLFVGKSLDIHWFEFTISQLVPVLCEKAGWKTGTLLSQLLGDKKEHIIDQLYKIWKASK